MCTHRAARLTNDCSRRKLLVCPFHAWSFDLDGRLVALPGEDSFATIDRSTRSLVKVPVGEWGGMVFVKAHAGDETIDVEAWLGDMGPELLKLNLAGAKLIKHSRVDVEANWKYALDTYGEGYHFGALHPTTFGTTTISNVILCDTFGPHYRVNFTSVGYRDLVGVDEKDWPVTPYGGSHLVFPNSIVYGAPMEGGGSMVGMYRLYPGDAPGKSFTIMSTYRGGDLPAETPDAVLEGAHDFIQHVVTTEDYSVSKEGQRNMEYAPAGFQVVFGRNEKALQNTHRHIAEAIGMPGMAKTAKPFLESQGWRLAGMFMQRSGRLGNIIDLWELEDFQHYDRALQAFMAQDSFPAFRAMLAETVISETVVFANKIA
eukprot:gene18588-18457_t